MGRFPECLNAPFSLFENPLENQPIKKRGIKRFLTIVDGGTIAVTLFAATASAS